MKEKIYKVLSKTIDLALTAIAISFIFKFCT